MSFNIPSKKYKLFVLSVAFVFTLAGLGLSYICHDPTIFARFGSIIVCFGVYLTWKDLTAGAKAYKHEIETWDGTEGLTSDEQIDAVLKYKRQKIAGAEEIIAVFNGLDVYIALYGTIIWGWGDLFLCLVSPLKCCSVC